jgi:hypothetical protein
MVWIGAEHCKTVGSAYVGSNPTSATTSENGPRAAETLPAGRFLLVTPCITVCHCGSMHGSVHVALAENLIRPGGRGCRVRRQPDQLVALRRSCLLRDDDRLCCFDWPTWLVRVGPMAGDQVAVPERRTVPGVINRCSRSESYFQAPQGLARAARRPRAAAPAVRRPWRRMTGRAGTSQAQSRTKTR